jgi:hypothetical protein
VGWESHPRVGRDVERNFVSLAATPNRVAGQHRVHPSFHPVTSAGLWSCSHNPSARF